MAIRINGIVYDELAADPGTPAEGESWYNTTEDRLKVFANGTVQVVAWDSELTSHENDTGNPHSVTLEQARTAGNAVIGQIDMGNNKIIQVANGTASTDAVNVSQLIDAITAAGLGDEWQNSVLDKDLATAPGSPNPGDRYIIAGTGGLWSPFSVNDIVEWNGSVWELKHTPNEGSTTRVDDENKTYQHNGSSWEILELTQDHGNLIGLGDDDHTQYLLINGTRNMSGNLNMGTFQITNVGNVDGVDVSDHSARHESGGSDEVDGDILDIDFVPANYARTTAPTEVSALVHLTAHLAGIDTAIGDLGSEVNSLVHKSGEILPGSFVGSTAVVTFSASFSDANYSPTAIAETSGGKAYLLTCESITSGSFVINKNSSSTSGLTKVRWTAIKHGESN